MEADPLKASSGTGTVVHLGGNMAISKIKPIKSTPEKAIAYILDPEKTEENTLVSSFACAPETAALEFNLTAKNGSLIGDRLAYHLIQAFSPEDNLTPQKAHELGMEFAKKVTGGKYEFVVSTHVDKGHIHNHIIFNATSFVDRKKYHSDAWDKTRIRNINDRICTENNLSVIKKFSGRKGKGRYEYDQAKKNSSWKDKLAKTIDEAIIKAENFEKFIAIMELEGYEVKQGKYIAFKFVDQDRFTRSKSIGPAYTEEAIKERIINKDKSVESTKNINLTPRKKQTNFQSDPSKINLLIDISKNIKAQESKGYERALQRSNIDTLVKSMNYMIRHNIVTPEDFSVYESGIKADYDLTRKSIKKLENELLDLSQTIKYMQDYKKNKSLYKQSLKETGNKEFYAQHEESILKYQIALLYFEKNHISPDEIKLHDLFEKYKSVREEETKLKKEFVPVKNAYKEMNIVKKNIEDSLGISLSKNDAVEKEGINISNDPMR